MSPLARGIGSGVQDARKDGGAAPIRTMVLIVAFPRINGKMQQRGGRVMIRRWHYGIPVLLLSMAIAANASAQALRSANVGDRMGSLTAGLDKVEGGPLGSCAPGSPLIRLTDYVVPGRTQDDDNASFQAFTVGDRVVALVAYDEDDLSAPVVVYADADGNGLITNTWSIENAPTLCAIVGNLHYRP
jgi:hypothetical protein